MREESGRCIQLFSGKMTARKAAPYKFETNLTQMNGLEPATNIHINCTRMHTGCFYYSPSNNDKTVKKRTIALVKATRKWLLWHVCGSKRNKNKYNKTVSNDNEPWTHSTSDISSEYTTAERRQQYKSRQCHTLVYILNRPTIMSLMSATSSTRRTNQTAIRRDSKWI